MDEIEFRAAYNEACTAAEHVSAPETRSALMLTLQLINALREQIEELQMQDDC